MTRRAGRPTEQHDLRAWVVTGGTEPPLFESVGWRPCIVEGMERPEFYLEKLLSI